MFLDAGQRIKERTKKERERAQCTREKHFSL